MRRTMTCLIALVVAAGCMEGTKPSPQQRAESTRSGTAPRTLYERMGGETVIVKVVDDFVANVAADDNIKEKHRKHFMEGDVAALKKKLVEQIGQATGGPQKYTGKDMKTAHKGMAITDKDFDQLVVDLVKALDNSKVGKAEQHELLTMLGGMRKEVVEATD